MKKIIPFPAPKKENLLTYEELLKFERIAKRMNDGEKVIEFPIPVKKDRYKQ